MKIIKNRLKIIFLAILISLSMITLSSYAIAYNDDNTENLQTIEIRYTFNDPHIEKIIINDISYDKIIIPDLINSANPGEPCLPTKGAYILIPMNMDIKNIDVKTTNKECLGMDYLILPAEEPIPISMSDDIKIPEPDPKIYNSSNEFPGELFKKIDNYYFRGYNILVLILNPVQYIPSTGEIYFYNDLTITVDLIENNHSNDLYRGLINDKLEIINKIDNVNIMDTYDNTANLVNFDDQYNLLILTTDTLKQNFQPLKEAHDSRGIRTEIKTLRDISLFPDRITPEDIRQFIKDEYIKNGIEYVLLGGDVELVPAKMLYVSGLDEGKWFYDTELPSDLYYACLDGEYNYDGDDNWGEPNDGDNGDDVDLIAEVFIGRACVENSVEVNNFVSKTIDYLNVDNEDDYLNKVCLAGEYLGDYGIASWGGNYLDQLTDGSELDGYNTTGIPSDQYEIEKLYDRDWINNDWEKNDIIQRINNNLHIISHDGHSNYVHNMKLDISDIEMLNNDKYFFAYSEGCMAGGFDQDDCIAEYFNVKTENGAFAVIMNARYGWFWSYSTDGDSSRFVRQFWDAVYGEKITTISKANQDSKEDNLFLIERSCMRWTYYQLNLFGDPTISFHISSPPDKPSIPSGILKGKIGEEYAYTTNTNDPDDDEIFYLFDWGDESISNWLGPYKSGESCEASHIWNKYNSYSIRVISKDINGALSEWSDPLTVSMPKNMINFKELYNKFFEYFSIFLTYSLKYENIMITKSYI